MNTRSNSVGDITKSRASLRAAVTMLELSFLQSAAIARYWTQRKYVTFFSLCSIYSVRIQLNAMPEIPKYIRPNRLNRVIPIICSSARAKCITFNISPRVYPLLAANKQVLSLTRIVSVGVTHISTAHKTATSCGSGQTAVSVFEIIRRPATSTEKD